MGQQKRTIAIDFDGVIHKYSRGWHNGTCYDEPMDGAIDAIHKLLHRKNIRIIIFTARKDLDEVRLWCKRWFSGWEPEVTNTKPIATAYIDDRAIRFTNWKDILNYF